MDKIQTFEERILEYFQPYWEVNRLPDNWLTMDDAELRKTTPKFHGMVIGNDVMLEYMHFKLKKVFADNGYPMSNSFAENGIYNRAGQWTFVPVDIKNATLGEVFRGRLYDIVILVQDKIEYSPEYIQTAANFVIEKDINRVIVI
jgi:hypothetical protein